VDEAPRSKLAAQLSVTLGFGSSSSDYDNDGWPDSWSPMATSRTRSSAVQKRVSYAEPPHLFRNLSNGKFEEVTTKVGAAFAAPKVARGAAICRHQQRTAHLTSY